MIISASGVVAVSPELGLEATASADVHEMPWLQNHRRAEPAQLRKSPAWFQKYADMEAAL